MSASQDPVAGVAEAATAIDPLVGLLRRFAVDWLDRADEQVCREIMDPGYTIRIGGVVLEGLDAYVPATAGQLHRFPGLMITVHDLVAAEGRAALRFTEHGGSTEGGQAAWRGIGLFWSDGRVLVRSVTEEDYFGRRRQLVDGVADAVDPPMVAPWNQRIGAPDPEAEKTVLAWLESGGPGIDDAGVILDDAAPGRPAPPVLEVADCAVEELFSADRQVAFQVMQRGTFAGGIPGLDTEIGREASLSMVGLVTVGENGAITGHAVRDRLGLRRRLRR